MQRAQSGPVAVGRSPSTSAAAPRPKSDNRALDAAMDRYARGDDAAFGELYDGLAPRIYGYLVRQCRNRGSAEELAQQTFMHMHRARGQFLHGASVLPWAFAIARRLFLDQIRKGRRELLTTSEEDAGVLTIANDPSAESNFYAGQIATRVQAVLATLPESQRTAFELLKLEELSVAEAAEVVGATSAAVKLRAHRAYQALRAALGDIALESADDLGEKP
ncbi:MAG: RNA polymerase sigma factor [Polyangiaceae bacterium]